MEPTEQSVRCPNCHHEHCVGISSTHTRLLAAVIECKCGGKFSLSDGRQSESYLSKQAPFPTIVIRNGGHTVGVRTDKGTS